MSGLTGIPAGLSPAQTLKWLARHSCAFYASQYLSGPPEAPYNGRFLVSEHHESWSKVLNEANRLCILAPRDHGKSYFFNLAYPIWQAEKHPGRYGFVFSGSQPQAERILNDIITEVETNPRLAHLIPKVKKHWSATKVRFANGHTIYARGYGTKVRGAHPIWIVCDDVLNDEDAFSETKRTRNIDYFYNAITPMCVPGGQIVVVGTPFHQQDLYGNLSKNEEYTFRRFKSIRNDGTALWPERYPISRLRARQKEVGRVRFAREYQCSPVSDGSSLFPSTLFSGPDIMRDDVVIGHDWRWWELHHNIKRRFIGVDYAISANVGADYTVLFVIGVDDFGNRWVMDIIRQKGLEFHQQLALIKAASAKYKPDIIACEANQMQRIFGDELIRTTDLPIRNIHTGDEKHSLEKGVPSLRVILENRKIRIPRGDERAREITDIWIEEMRNHTFYQGKVQSVGDHDDTTMAWFVGEKAIKSGMFSFAFGDDDNDMDEQTYREMMGIVEPGDPTLGGGAYATGDPEMDKALNSPIVGHQRKPGAHHRKKARIIDPHELHQSDFSRDQWGKPKIIKQDVRPAKEVLDKGGAPPASAFFLNGGRW